MAFTRTIFKKEDCRAYKGYYIQPSYRGYTIFNENGAMLGNTTTVAGAMKVINLVLGRKNKKLGE